MAVDLRSNASSESTAEQGCRPEISSALLRKFRVLFELGIEPPQLQSSIFGPKLPHCPHRLLITPSFPRRHCTGKHLFAGHAPPGALSTQS